MHQKDIRDKFFKYFSGRGHKRFPSAPIVVKDDPTLMFTNAGMNQFKDIFLGDKQSASKRVVNTQKCLRVSGKHNDLEEVGIDTYHHTMFEMLGNWSFGDYFKEEAIKLAWDLLTKVYNIDKRRLYVTVFEGDKKDKLPFDQEAYDCWKEIFEKENQPIKDRLLKFGKKENFWEMGESGPCGPCSEIHVDLRSENEWEKGNATSLVNKGDPRVVELWNLVFIQYNRSKNGVLNELPQKHVDTGMGFERLCMVLQDKNSNYDTDVFQPLIKQLEKLAGKQYRGEGEDSIAIRVIADHIRAISFTIADGQLPSNTGAGYVVRRILRRAVRYGYSFLGFREAAIYQLLDTLVKEMGEAFPELNTQKELIQKVIKEEEEAFLRTLSRGITQFNKYLQDKGEKKIPGKFAFELYDTYGFPIDLTQLMAKENKCEVDMKGFHQELGKQKERSKCAAKVDTEDWIELKHIKAVEFVGYQSLEAAANIVKYRKVKQKDRELYQLILNRTPFYAESGGQAGDKGSLEINGEKIQVIDTKKENELTIHLTEKMPKKPEGKITAKVDMQRRSLTAGNHSATHLLHAALRKVLGSHVQQRGSYLDDAYLRFDFTHFTKVTDKELSEIEKTVNEKIRENIPLDEKTDIPFDKAKKMGAAALFGEKYGDKVRVITFDKGYSVELCGGTHVKATGQIGYFKIIAESAVAAGVRRIEAVSGPEAESYMDAKLQELELANKLLKHPKDFVQSIKSLLDEKQKMSKALELLYRKQAAGLKDELLKNIVKINGIQFISHELDNATPDILKDIAFELKRQVDNMFLVLGSSAGSKAYLTIMLSDNLVKEKQMNAVALINTLAKEINGGGGGQAFFATAGGKNIKGLPKALEKAKEIVKDQN